MADWAPDTVLFHKGASRNNNPAWSPNGKWITDISGRSGKHGVGADSLIPRFPAHDSVFLHSYFSKEELRIGGNRTQSQRILENFGDGGGKHRCRRNRVHNRQNSDVSPGHKAGPILNSPDQSGDRADDGLIGRIRKSTAEVCAAGRIQPAESAPRQSFPKQFTMFCIRTGEVCDNYGRRQI
jgi:hypothetical protein